MRVETRGAALLIVVATAAVYCNSLSGPFIFDDHRSILENPNCRRLWPITEAMSAPPGTGMSSRPVAALSLAVNYALGGYDVFGYHVFNVLIHALASLTLLGLVRRTIPMLGRKGAAGASLGIAPAVALIFAVHPLVTDALNHVTYRHEAMMGFSYLVTLYCFVRCARTRAAAGWWAVLAVLACAAGMGSKENMVSAPLLVLLFDRVLIASSFGEALRRRWGLYVGLALTWAVLGASIAGGFRGKLVGFELEALPAYEYVLTQFGVLLYYLRLCVWPAPLVLDYEGWPVATSLAKVWPAAVAVGVIGFATIWALWRRKWPGLIGAVFFCVLAPTTLIPNAGEVAAEHRMYLPLAGVILLAVAAVDAALRSWGERVRLPNSARRSLALVAVVACVMGLGFLTKRRNEDYRTAVSIWRDTVTKRPDNPRANNNLGNELLNVGAVDEALPFLRRVLELKPGYPQAWNNIGRASFAMGRYAEAADHFRRALRHRGDLVPAWNNLGNALRKLGQLDEALASYRRAIECDPEYAIAHHNVGALLLQKGAFDAAVAAYSQALRIDPNIAKARIGLARALSDQGRNDQALAQAEMALAIDPASADFHRRMGMILGRLERFPESVAAYERSLGLDSQQGATEYGLGHVLAKMDRVDEAMGHFDRASELLPDSADVYAALSDCFFRQKDYQNAVDQARRAVNIDSELAAAQVNLGNGLLMQGKIAEAIAAYREALRIDPDDGRATSNLRVALTRRAGG